MSDTQKFQTVFANLKMAESGNQHTDQYGNLIRSKAGAEGITQLMPATASNPGFGVEPAKDKSQAEYERVGRELLQAFVKRYDGDYEKALAAYNAGPGNVDKAIKRAEEEGGNWKDYLPKPEETLPYIEKILGGSETKPEVIEGSVEGAKGVEEDMPPPFGPIRTNIKWQSLKEDPSWLDASELIYRFYYGKPFEGTDEELAEWGLQFMADMDWSLVTLGKVSNKLGDLTDLETKMALSYMMDTFDNVDLSAGGVWRGVKAFATDPFNFVGLGTFGIGTVGKAVAQQGAKLTFRQALKQSLGRSGVIAGIDGMLFTGIETRTRQNIDVELGRREDFDNLELAGKTLLGGAVAGTVGTAIDMAASKIARMVASRRRVSQSAADGVDVNLGASASGKGSTGSAKAGGEVVEVPKETPVPKKLKGRRPEDDVIVGPDTHTKQTLKDGGFDLPDLKTGLRATPQNLKEALDLARNLARQIADMDIHDVGGVVEALRRSEMTMEEHRQLALSVQMATDRLKVERAYLMDALMNPQKDDRKLLGRGSIRDLQARLHEIEQIIMPIEMMDEAFSSMYGSALQQRRQGLTDLRGISPETIRQQYPDLTKEQADKLYIDTVLRVGREKQARDIRNSYAQDIQAAHERGDWDTVVRLLADRERAIDDLFADLTGSISGLEKYARVTKATLSDKANELAISNVFSTLTLAVNLVPSAIKMVVQPFIHAITTNPLERATRIEMAGNYAAMLSGMRGAIEAAKVAFRYEQALLTRDNQRFLESGLALEGRWAGVVRTIPRLMNATDEFLSRLAYEGYVGGRAAAEAYVEGISRGMTTRRATRFAKHMAEKAIKNAYKQHDIDAQLVPIVNKAVNRGLKGKELDEWVIKEARKNLKHIKFGTDKEALDYVRDVLYKRRPSGQGLASQAVRWMEDGLNRMPALKWATGQLFFRTPIRVMEEGLRLTPGVQFFMPHFLSDLAGKNGLRRQAKAQGEALLSLAFGAAVVLAYAKGDIQGAGVYDYRQRRLRQDSDLADPYTIRMEDGSTWSYRIFDPIATPMKIMVTALEYHDHLRIREAQGEFIDKPAYDKAAAMMSSALMPIVLAISDANLFAGVTTTVKLAGGFENLEGEHNAFIKYLGERLKWVVPNTAHKLYRTYDPEMRDPLTFSQVVQTQLGPIGAVIEEASGVKTSKAYDVLGNVRTITDTGALWNIFSTASIEERQKGRSEEELQILREMDRLARVTGATFSHGYKHPMTGDLDLRTVMTKDGSKTLYDRWMEIYRELDPVTALGPVVNAPLPDGTFETKAAKVETIQRILKDYRDIAFKRLMTEEEGLTERFIQHTIRESQAKGGLWDYGRKENPPQFLK